MPSSRRIITPLAAITILIILSVLTLISIGEGFKKLGVERDGEKLRRDTITFNMPWNPPKKVKAISPASGSILDAVENVAAALLGGGSDIASFARGAVGSVSATVLDGAPSQVPSQTQDINSAVYQATGVVGGIVSAATGIVGSLMAGTGAGSVTSAVGGERNSSAGGNATGILTKTTASALRLNASSSTSNPAFNITSAPVLNELPSTSAIACASSPTCTACPAPSTETCTVTETWHSTHFESTATFFSFVAAFTSTCTETVSVCPKSSLYPLAPPNASASASPTHPVLVACPDGSLAKRAEDCPPTSGIFNATIPTPANASIPSLYPQQATLSHPCPNAGYTCSECPDGVFCPPTPTPAQDCVCGYGWACGHCSQGWFCIPSPTSGPGSALTSSAAVLFGNASESRFTSSSAPLSMASFTANMPSLSSVPSALAMASSASGPLQAFPTSRGPLNPATGSAGDLAGNIINNVNSALGNVNGLSGAILSSVMGQLSSVLIANFPFETANPTSLVAASGAAGNLISSATGVVGNVLSSVAATVGNPVGGLIPTATSIVGSVAGNALSNVPTIGGNPAAGLVPTATASIGGVAGQLLTAGVPGASDPAGGLVPTAAVIIGGIGSDLLAAGIPVATPAPIFQPTVTIPVINNVLPVFGKAVVQKITITVIPQPLSTTGAQTSSLTNAPTIPAAPENGPNVISHLTTTVQGTPTVLPVVITVLNGKPTVVPLVQMMVDGRAKDLPVVGVDLGAGSKQVEAAEGVLDGGKRTRGRGEGVVGEDDVGV